jgi:hypothetical protein
VQEVFSQKEFELAKVRKELEALRIVAELLMDVEDWPRVAVRPTLTITGQSLIEAEAVIDSLHASSSGRGAGETQRNVSSLGSSLDAEGAQPEIASEQTPHLNSLGAVLMESLIERERGNVAVGSRKVLAEDHERPSPQQP